MSREGGDKNSKTQAEQTAQLEELINAYSHGGQDKNESEKIRSEEIERRKENLDVSRERLLKNGVPIDPDLVEEVTGGDRSNITIPKAELSQDRGSNNASRGGHVKSAQRNSTESTTNIIRASSGEEIISDSRAVEQIKGSESVDDVNPVDDENISTRETKRRRREINKAIDKAHRKYGHDNYNRLDPSDYEPEKIAERKKMRARSQLRRIVVVAVILIILAGAAGAVVYQLVNPPLDYVVNYCTEQDVLSAVDSYKKGDIQSIDDYITSKSTGSEYSVDAKCGYIAALSYAMKGNIEGVNYQYDMINQSTDADSVNKLIEKNHLPSADELKNSSNSSANTEDDVIKDLNSRLAQAVNDGDRLSIYSEKVYHYLALGNINDAKEEIAKMLEALPNSYEAFGLAGDLYSSGQINDLDAAINSYNQAIELLQTTAQVDNAQELISYYSEIVDRLSSQNQS